MCGGGRREEEELGGLPVGETSTLLLARHELHAACVGGRACLLADEVEDAA